MPARRRCTTYSDDLGVTGRVARRRHDLRTFRVVTSAPSLHRRGPHGVVAAPPISSPRRSMSTPRSHLADDPPVEITTIRSDRSRISSSSVEISSTPTPGAAAAELLGHVLDRADVEPASVGRRPAPRSVGQLAASTTRCWLPPDRDHMAHRAGAADLVPIDQSRRRSIRRDPSDAVAGDRSGSAMNRFSAIVKSSTHPESCRSSGITATPCAAMPPARPVSTTAPSILTAAVEGDQARHHVAELALTVALDAGDADDLAGGTRRSVGRAPPPRRARSGRRARRRRSGVGSSTSVASAPLDHGWFGLRCVGRRSRSG